MIWRKAAVNSPPESFGARSLQVGLERFSHPEVRLLLQCLKAHTLNRRLGWGTYSSEAKPKRLISFSLSREVTNTLDLQEVLNGSLRALRRLIDFDGGSIQLITDGALRLVASDPAAPKEVYDFRLPLGHGFGGKVAQSGEPIYSADATVDPRADPVGRKKASVPGVRSYFAAPLIMRGEPIGIVQIDSMVVDAFSEEDQALVLSFLPTIAAAVQNALLFDQERESLEKLRDLDRLKHDFIALISHELRTPLTSVTGFAETIEHRGKDLAPQLVSDMAHRIGEAGERLRHLVDELLDLSKLERGELEMKTVPTDLQRLIRSLAEPAGNIDVTLPSTLPKIRTDPHRLTQVLNLLVENARKFSPPDSPVHLSAAVMDGRVSVTVSDHGPGIPSDMVEKVFEPFFQLEEAMTRTSRGIGVGLYFVREMCEAMGAKVAVESEVGRGSSFTVHLSSLA